VKQKFICTSLGQHSNDITINLFSSTLEGQEMEGELLAKRSCHLAVPCMLIPPFFSVHPWPTFSPTFSC